jgi:hypothetical protein
MLKETGSFFTSAEAKKLPVSFRAPRRENSDGLLLGTVDFLFAGG